MVLLIAGPVFAQSAPASPDRPSHFPGEQQIEDAAKPFREARFSIETDTTYTLAELVNLAEEHNPETRAAWENARVRAPVLHCPAEPVQRDRWALYQSSLASEQPPHVTVAGNRSSWVFHGK